MSHIEKVFNDYVIGFMNDKKNLDGYIDKYHHSYFVRDEALLVDKNFTKYNSDFKKLLEIQSLYHDIGRFLQLNLVGNFVDYELAAKFKGIEDHGDLGAIVMKQLLLRKLFPDDCTFDKEIVKVIELHTKDNRRLLEWIQKEYIEIFRNYEIKELLNSRKSESEKKALTAINTAIIQDADRLDIFRKIVNGIWVPASTNDEISKKVWDMFKSGNLPSIAELKDQGYWNPNVGHLVRMNFINQMCLVPELQKIKDEHLIQKVYEVSGNEIVRPAYEYALERIDTLIEQSEDKVLVKRNR